MPVKAARAKAAQVKAEMQGKAETQGKVAQGKAEMQGKVARGKAARGKAVRAAVRAEAEEVAAEATLVPPRRVFRLRSAGITAAWSWARMGTCAAGERITWVNSVMATIPIHWCRSMSRASEMCK